MTLSRLLWCALLVPLASCLMDETRPLRSEDCKNNANFIDGQCNCTLAYVGRTCEEPKCLNGVPQRLNGKERCSCRKGFGGARCELVKSCEPGKGKLKNGKCECERGYTGLRCEESPCQNGYPVPGEVNFCLCENGWTGNFCDVELICEHGGFVDSNNECSCRKGYAGMYCELCDIGYIKEHGVCVSQVSEASMSQSSLTDYPFTWSLVLICVGAATTLLALVGVMTIVVKKWKSKPSRVSSVQGDGDRGTDV